MEKKTKINITKIILGVLAFAGMIGVALVAPNALQALDIFYKKNKRKYNKNFYVKSRINKMIESGLIEIINKNGMRLARLTDKGRQKLLKYKLGEIGANHSAGWDGKWRIISFDIRERRRSVRQTLRRELIGLNFVRLQDSVWVYPYDCEDVVILLKSYLKTGGEILYIIAEKIENDRWLRREFDLSLK